MTASIKLMRKALGEAGQADILALNAKFTGLGDHVRDEFVKGMTLYLDAYEKTDNDRLQHAEQLLDRWAQYYNDNVNRIRQGNR